MKKLLALLLVMVLAVASLTACSPEEVIGTVKDKTVDVFNTVKTTVGGWFGIEFEEDTNDDANNETNNGTNDGTNDSTDTPSAESELDLALKTLNTLYKEAEKKTPVNYTLMAKVVTTTGKTVVVSWASNNAAITIVPDENNENLVKVVVPAGGDVDVNYTITATLTNDKGETKTVSYDRVIPATNQYMTIDEYYALNVRLADNKSVTVKGIVTGIVSKSAGWEYNQLFLQDESGKGGYYVYDIVEAPMDEIKVGMTVKVNGIKNVNWGVDRIEKSTVEILDTTIKTVTPVDYTAEYLAAETLTDADLNKLDGLLVKLTGVEITGVTEGQGYYHFLLGNKESYVRISSSTTAMSKADVDTFKATHAANTGKLADVVGVITSFNNAFYLVPVSVDAYSNFRDAERSPEDKINYELGNLGMPENVKVDSVIDLLTAGKVYKDVVISWATDSTAAVISTDGKTVTITLGDAEQTVTLKATATLGDKTVTKDVVIKVAAKPNFIINYVDNPVANTPYKLYLFHATKKENMFLNGRFDSQYNYNLGTTGDFAQAADFYLVATDGGYYLKTVVDNVTKYLNLTVDEKYLDITLDMDPITVFKYDTALKTIVATFDHGADFGGSKTWYLGTYASNAKTGVTTSETYRISGNNAAQVGVSQFVLSFVTLQNASEISDADKVAMEKGKLDIDTTVTEDVKITLPTATLNGVTVSWIVSNAEIVDGKLVITLGDAAKTVTLTATIIAGEASDTKVFTFEVPKKPAEGEAGTKVDIETITSNSYSGDKTTTSGWVLVNGMANSDMGCHTLVLNGKTATIGVLTSPVLHGGLSKITFKYGNPFGEANGVDITIDVLQDGKVVASKKLDNDSVTQLEKYSYTFVLDTPVIGDYQIRITNNCPSNNASKNKDRVALWDIYYYGAEQSGDSGDEGDDNKPTFTMTPVTNPEADKAYKLYFFQGGKQLGYYLDGTTGKYSYYLNGNENLPNALTAYLVAVDGGYNLKVVFADGTEKYLNIHEVSGGYVNSLYETLEENATPTVYTFDTELKTLSVYVDASQDSKKGTYVLASYSTFTNLSACLTTKTGPLYYLQLVEINCTHEFDADCDDTCDVCGFFRTGVTVEHTYADNCDTDCEKCGATREEAPHNYVSECDTTCDCGATREVTAKHTAADACATDCDLCGEAVVPTHKYVSECDTTCDCGETREVNASHTYESDCEAKCSLCGDIRVAPHKYTSDCDTTCDCGETRETTAEHEYADECDANCENCGAERTAPHKYASDCDTTCDCGVTRETTAEHKYANECDANCENCGAERTAPHKYTSECDTTCDCGATRTATADHVFNGGCEDTDCDNGCGATREPVKHSYPHECTTECNNKNCNQPAPESKPCKDGDGDGLCDYGCGNEISSDGDVPAVPVG